MDAVRRRRAWDLGMSRRGLAAVALLAVLPQVVLPVAARAQVGSDRSSSIVVDVASGAVLEQDSADAPRHPASLAKLMTLYLVFEALRDRRISLNELVPVSVHSAEMEPTKLGLTPNTKITVQQAILGLVTKSANDAAAALGEMLGGSEDRFAEMMTLRARAMGMAHTTFMNASGLPDERQVSTARDLAMLGRRLVTDFPDDYRYFSTPSFQFGRQTIFNHDNMLRSYPGADGMKTGYTEASGHNLVTSAVRDGPAQSGLRRDGRHGQPEGDTGREPCPQPDLVRACRVGERGAPGVDADLRGGSRVERSGGDLLDRAGRAGGRAGGGARR
jgi:D-alanyl-D-alanine carboxypeptidase